MRLVIREYLSMLKESGELDALLPDLLLAMGIDPLSRPGIGNRQFGVDLPAVGIDPEDGQRKLFLITIKQGDISRNDWDTGKNAVRPSLNEILDSYLRTRIRPEHEALPKKIILATNGELKEDVSPDWTNYTYNHAGVHPSYGPIEFDFWGGDTLSLLIERHLLDEYLFPESAQKKVRKTIALADQNEDEPRFFYSLIEEVLFERDLPEGTSASARRKRQHALRLLNLSLNIVFHWCGEADNLRPALLCSERLVLRTWDWMRQQELLEDQTTLEEFARIFHTYLNIARAYAIKLQPFCHVRDGLFGFGADEIEYPLRTFDLIGVLGVLSMTLTYLAAAVPTDQNQLRDQFQQEALAVSHTLAILITNNPAALTPSYDGHAIDIALGLLALFYTGHHEDAAKWVDELCGRINFAYQIGRLFPIASDSYDDLVAMQVGQAPPKEKLMELSTLLPKLAEWLVVLNQEATYQAFAQAVPETFEKTDLQLWYPDETTDQHLYRTNAGRASGATLSSIKLPQSMDELRARIVKLQEQRQIFEQLSCVKHGWPMLGLLASRHFRTPVIPAYWQRILAVSASADNDEDDAP